jgi:hypothetical protein
MASSEQIERTGRALIDAAPALAKVILFGSHARGDADEGSDLDFLVIEQDVEDGLAEGIRTPSYSDESRRSGRRNRDGRGRGRTALEGAGHNGRSRFVGGPHRRRVLTVPLARENAVLSSR